MVWVPGGTLISGSELDAVPRAPEIEPAAVPVLLGGFYIDVFLHPNESGALPTTALTQSEAEARCAEVEKRLCSELELERACKGPDNLRYPYGATFHAEACEAVATPHASPNGFHAGCRSRFGVQDTHGTWVWSSSSFGRGTEGLATLKGGFGADHELVGRCAHSRGIAPTTRSNEIGFRCCLGEPNPQLVELAVKTGTPLRYRGDDPETEQRAQEALAKHGTPPDGNLSAAADASAKPLRVERTWNWNPVGNEALLIAGGCSEPPKRCGVFVLRNTAGSLVPLAFLATDRWQPTVSEAGSARMLSVQGGDEAGAFRKSLVYQYGRFSVGEKEHKARPNKRRKNK